eukprot:jgi/Psemu1/16990/gm1.16990_g
MEDSDPDLLYLDINDLREVKVEEEEKQLEARGRRHSGHEEMEIEGEDEAQSNTDLLGSVLNKGEFIKMMEQALIDPDMNSTWKQVIDHQVRERIKELQMLQQGNPGPDNDGSSGDDDHEDDPMDDSSRTRRYNRCSLHPKITIKGFNNERILNPEQLAFRNSLMDFGINQESANEIMRGGMSHICEVADLNKERVKSFMLGLKENNPPELKDLSKFREWEEGFRQNLRYRFNSEEFQILYVIRPKEKESVDDGTCSRTVGQSSTDMFQLGLTTMDVVWRLLCDATRKGPEWEYVAHFQNSELNSGNARNAFLSLIQHACMDANIMMKTPKTPTISHAVSTQITRSGKFEAIDAVVEVKVSFAIRVLPSNKNKNKNDDDDRRPPRPRKHQRLQQNPMPFPQK